MGISSGTSTRWLFVHCVRIENFGILKCWFLRRGEKRSTRRKNLSEQGRGPTTTKKKLNPGHIGERRLLSPLRHPCSPMMMMMMMVMMMMITEHGCCAWLTWSLFNWILGGPCCWPWKSDKRETGQSEGVAAKPWGKEINWNAKTEKLGFESGNRTKRN